MAYDFVLLLPTRSMMGMVFHLSFFCPLSCPDFLTVHDYLLLHDTLQCRTYFLINDFRCLRYAVFAAKQLSANIMKGFLSSDVVINRASAAAYTLVLRMRSQVCDYRQTAWSGIRRSMPINDLKSRHRCWKSRGERLKARNIKRLRLMGKFGPDL